MLDALTRWSLQNRAPVLTGGGLLLVLGIWTAFGLPVDVFPDLTAPTVTIVAEAADMSPEDVEPQVTVPIETALNGAAGVRRVRSSTSRGIAVIWVDFEWGTDILRARQVVAERLHVAASGLPPGLADPVLTPISSIMGEIMMIGITGTRSPRELRTAADWTVRPRLLALPGVAQVASTGGEVKQIEVLPDRSRMLESRISLREVMDAAAGAGTSASGGVYTEGGRDTVIRGVGSVRSPEEIAETLTALRAGAPVRLGDVATVRIGSAQKFGDGSVNARPAVVLSVQKQPDANTLDVTRRIEAELEEIQRTLPEGITIHADLFRQERFIRLAVANLLEALRDGAILVVLILFLFFWSWRLTVISVLAVPLSLVVAVFALRAWGASIDAMTLGGMAIAIGALADDAIISVENVSRRLRENRQRPEGDRLPPIRVIYDASREIRSSIVSATLVIIVVFLPLFFLGRVEGRLLRPLGFTYVVSLVASLLVAVTVTPVLCSLLLSRGRVIEQERESAVVARLKEWYRPALARALERPQLVVTAVGVAWFVTLAAVPFLGTSFLPRFNEGTLTVSVVSAAAASLEEADAIGRQAEEILLAHPAVENVDRRQGRGELDERATRVNAGKIHATLAEGMDEERTLAELREALAGLPGTDITIGQPISHRIDYMLSGTSAAIAIKVLGPDLEGLRRLGASVEQVVRDVPGLVDVKLEQQVDVPQVRIRGDRARLARHGLSVSDLADSIDVAFGGRVVAQVLEEGRSLDLVVRLPDSPENSDAIPSMRIDTPMGTRVALSEVAEIQQEPGPNTISREGVARKIVVQANVVGSDLGSTVTDLKERVRRQVELPAGYRIEYGGQFESQTRASRTIGLLSVISVVLIFLILIGEFRSLRVVLLVMVNLPLALIGGVAAVLLVDPVLSIASLVGFVTLFGIATRNGVLLLSHYQRLQDEGVPLWEAIVRGSMERLAPILMTALTAGLALIPLALRGGEPGSEIQSPMAVVILGGLLTATGLNMLVLPALYWLLGASAPRIEQERL